MASKEENLKRIKALKKKINGRRFRETGEAIKITKKSNGTATDSVQGEA